MKERQIRPMVMSEQIAEKIMEAILRGDYEPGDPIREQELASAFGVSRGPIREALRILEKSGVVCIVAQRGAHVTQLTAEEISNLFEIRAALAPVLAQHLNPIEPEVMCLLEKEVVEMERLSQDPEAWGEFAQVSYRLSLLLFNAAGNRQVSEIMESLALQTARYTYLGMQDPVERQFSARGWRRVADALGRGDAKAVGAAMVELMEGLHRTVLEILSRTKQSIPAASKQTVSRRVPQEVQ